MWGGLSRIDDIAFDRLFDIAVGIGGVVLQILDRLFAAPAFVVDAGVDDEAAGAPQLHAEPPEIAVGIGIEAHVLGQPFGIEPPALGIGGEAAEAAEGRQAGQLGLHRALQRSEEHTSELQSLMRISYAVFCLKKKTKTTQDDD